MSQELNDLPGIQGNFYVILEKDHIHLEHSEGIPNIKGFERGKHFYTTVKKPTAK